MSDVTIYYVDYKILTGPMLSEIRAAGFGIELSAYANSSHATLRISGVSLAGGNSRGLEDIFRRYLPETVRPSGLPVATEPVMPSPPATNTAELHEWLATAALTPWEDCNTIQKKKEHLACVLSRLGITGVFMTYEGSGDSGNVVTFEYTSNPHPFSFGDTDADPDVNDDWWEQRNESLAVYTYAGQKDNPRLLGWNSRVYDDALPKVLIPDDGARHDLEGRVRALMWGALGHYHGGWENNDGGRGAVMFDVMRNMIQVSHVDYVQSEEHSISNFLPEGNE